MGQPGLSVLSQSLLLQMSFFVADRRFYVADVANGLYAPSSYYVATMLSGV